MVGAARREQDHDSSVDPRDDRFRPRAGRHLAGDQALLPHPIDAVRDLLRPRRQQLLHNSVPHRIGIELRGEDGERASSAQEPVALDDQVAPREALESGVGIERLLDVDPDVLFVATDGPGTVFETWQTNSAWASMAAAADGAIFEVDRNQWARFRGLQTAELIAEEIVQNVVGER
ncbi:hypothetical protein MF406_11320 [Georgenia sp. TF02-10]|uniref:hypothetical protein n=1 Tax=Georgenia sp. TF02-10 TaxID=2917725 RepID=UPI001FA7BFE7|nr:hypothetical protein [Georgenia sp. TF02-10]UNX53578.1 hypothetical protein MF406_11320 [Georgenia sp. TF02-10]